LVFAGKRRHDNHPNIFGLCCRTQDIKHIKAADFWHHDVADDKLWPFFYRHSEGFFTVASRDNVVAFGEQTDAINFSQAFVIFYK
jgi:hypothetical protein